MKLEILEQGIDQAVSMAQNAGDDKFKIAHYLIAQKNRLAGAITLLMQPSYPAAQPPSGDIR